LGLCWYTIDPLGLHWAEERRFGAGVPAAARDCFGSAEIRPSEDTLE
jgi:hypothetical protein